MIAVGGHYLGHVPEALIRASCPFAGGIGGCRHDLCGVLSGGVMVLGALWGRVSSAENDRFVLDLTARYRERFVGVYGTATCEAIREIARSPEDGCLPVVLEGARILAELIEKARAEGHDTPDLVGGADVAEREPAPCQEPGT